MSITRIFQRNGGIENTLLSTGSAYCDLSNEPNFVQNKVSNGEI
jgi:hypothetical protein